MALYMPANMSSSMCYWLVSCGVCAVPPLQHNSGCVLQKAVEFHASRILGAVTHDSIHGHSGLVFGDDHDGTQEVLQTFHVFGMVSHEAMDLAQIISNDHVESNARYSCTRWGR